MSPQPSRAYFLMAAKLFVYHIIYQERISVQVFITSLYGDVWLLWNYSTTFIYIIYRLRLPLLKEFQFAVQLILFHLVYQVGFAIALQFTCTLSMLLCVYLFSDYTRYIVMIWIWAVFNILLDYNVGKVTMILKLSSCDLNNDFSRTVNYYAISCEWEIL